MPADEPAADQRAPRRTTRATRRFFRSAADRGLLADRRGRAPAPRPGGQPRRPGRLLAVCRRGQPTRPSSCGPRSGACAGSVPVPGPARRPRYGGNTSCVRSHRRRRDRVHPRRGHRHHASWAPRSRAAPAASTSLLTHLHLDHIQGLMFFAPLFDPPVRAHRSGARRRAGLRAARARSPATSRARSHPVEIRELARTRRSSGTRRPPRGRIGAASRSGRRLVAHRGPTLGYRLTELTARGL